jgi:hypothetical protein
LFSFSFFSQVAKVGEAVACIKWIGWILQLPFRMVVFLLDCFLHCLHWLVESVNQFLAIMVGVRGVGIGAWLPHNTSVLRLALGAYFAWLSAFAMTLLFEPNT